MRRIRPLCYHKISDDNDDFNLTHVSVDNFENQMKWIKHNYEIIHSADIGIEVNKEGRDAVVITFDDGYADVLRNALPVLEEYEIPATVFITTGNIDNLYPNYMESIIDAVLKPRIYRDYFEISDDFIHCRWNTRNLNERVALYNALGQLFRHIEPDRRIRYEDGLYEWAGFNNLHNDSKRVMTSEEIRRLSKSRLITMGSHTVNHASLGWISEHQQIYEVMESKEKLESIISKSVDQFAYPWGSKDDYSNVSVKILKEVGYKYAFTTSNNEMTDGFDPFRIPRWIVHNYNQYDFAEYMRYKVMDLDVDKHSRANYGLECFSGFEYIGYIRNDLLMLNSNAQIVIWGYGYCGKKLYKEIKCLGVGERIVGFADNDPSKQGISDSGLKVLSLDEVMDLQSTEIVQIMVPGKYNWEIGFGLIGKSLNNLHVILD